MKQKRSVKKLRTHAGNFLFLFPAMLLYCFVVIVPFIQGIPYSFTNRASVVSQSYDFVGLRNYMELITNKYFQQAFFHTVQFTVIYVIGANVLGLALALMLSRSSRFNNLARTIMFIPFTVALTSGAIVWSYVFTDVYSPLFQKMSPLGLSSQVVPAIVSNVTLLIAWGLKCFDYPMAVARNMEAAQTVSMYVYDYIFGFNKAGIGQAAAIIITVVLVVITQCITSIGAKLEVDQ